MFRIYTLSVNTDGSRTVQGVAEFSRNCDRATYQDHRQLLRKQAPEQVEYAYEVL